MDRWATTGEAPQPSRVPRRSEGTLVSPEEALKRFPKIPAINLPATPSRLPYWNYGPDFDDRGIMSVFPPEAVKGKEYPIQFPQVDADGNDLGGVRYPDMQVPLRTYLGWALRKAGFAEGELLSTNGCIITFARTKAEREKNGDPRLSIEERFPSRVAYVEAVKRAVDGLVKEGLDATGRRRALHRGRTEKKSSEPVRAVRTVGDRRAGRLDCVQFEGGTILG